MTGLYEFNYATVTHRLI